MKSLFIILLLSLSTFQVYAGDKGNGGDGVVLNYTSGDKINYISGFDSQVFEDSLTRALNHEEKRQLYSLDLVDMGLELSPKIKFQNQETSNSEEVCIESYGCYNITNINLFDRIVKKGAFWGQASEDLWKSPHKELVNNRELYELFQTFQENNKKEQKAAWANLKATFDKKQIPYSTEELTQMKEATEIAQTAFTKKAKENHPRARNYLFSKDAILAVGIINKIELIRSKNIFLAELFTSTLLKLDWIIINLPLNEVNDEGEIASQISNKIQMANRSNGVVKITRQGWGDLAFNTSNFKNVLPMNAANRLAVIAHEVFYEITRKQGDTTSERARLLTGFLFNTEEPEGIDKITNLLRLMEVRP